MNAALRQSVAATPRPKVIRYQLRYRAQAAFAATLPDAMTRIVESDHEERGAK